MLSRSRVFVTLVVLAAIALAPAAVRAHQRATASDAPHQASLRFSHSCSSAPEKTVIAADVVVTPEPIVVELPRPTIRRVDVIDAVAPNDLPAALSPDRRPPPSPASL